jgi:[ribosomal protein S18]-alanine N-acetyltransferase
MVNELFTARDLVLRRLRLTDIPAIMAIEPEAFGRFHWSAKAFEQEMNNHLARYWVLCTSEALSDQLLGYFGYWLVVEEMHVTTLAIAAEQRGKHLGALLIAKVLEQACNHTAAMVTLEVRRSNIAAQHLYTKYGFEVMGVRPHYYQDNGEDALIMTVQDTLDEANRARYTHCKTQLTERFEGLPAGF